MSNQNDDLDDQLYILLASMKEYREAIADDKKRLEAFYSQIATGVLDKAEKSLQDTNKQAIGALKSRIQELDKATSRLNIQFIAIYSSAFVALVMVVFYEWLIENMYEICEREPATLEEMVIRTCSIKKMVVEKDPTEQGDRALLNLGHTIGHAIEKAKNFELYHGECVALGTVAAAYISWKKEMLSMEEFYEIRDMFVPFYLPISVDDIDPQEILKLTKSDKKMEAGKIKFILLKKIGKAVIDRTVTDDEILAAIEEINFSEEDAHE